MQLSPNPDDRRVTSKILGISAKVGENIAGGKLMSRSVRAADNKMAVMLDRNPLNSESFLQGLRQKQHRWGAAWGIQNRFNQRFCIETVLTQKSSRDYCLEDVAILTEGKSSCRLQPSCQLDFQQLEMAYLVAPHMCKVHSPSNLRGSCNFHQIQANEFCLWKLASAYFRLCVEDDRSKFSLCSCKI